MNTCEIVESMTLREKIAQMIVVRGIGFEDRVQEMLKNGEIGAIGAVRLEDRTIEGAIKTLNHYLEISKNPILFYIDAEWGVAQMFPAATRFPTQMSVGASRSKELAYQMGQVIAREAKAMGFRILGSPTLDINNNYKNPIINTRAFGDRSDLVIELGRAYLQGVQDMNVIPTGKHYPGHGDTAVDSHVSMPVVTRDRESVMEIELSPYRALAKDMWGVMTAHIFYPALTGEDEGEIPATLSRKIMYDLLRGEFGFEGLIISDSLTMKGIKVQYGLDAAVLAIKAGHDIILQDYEDDPIRTIDRVHQAVLDGELSEEQIDESVMRIYKFREKIGALENKPIDIDAAKCIVACTEHREVAQKIAEAGCTLLENECMPLSKQNTGRKLVIATVTEEEGERCRDFDSGDDDIPAKLVSRAIAKRCDSEYVYISENPTEEEVSQLIERAAEYDHVIFASFLRPTAYKATSGTITENQQELIRGIMERAKNFIFLAYGSPYCLMSLPKMKNCIVAYGDDEFSIEAGVRVLFGEITATGRLPVEVAGRYAYGYRLEK